MTADQYESLLNVDVTTPTISVNDLADKTPRTLAYGYTIDRETVHTYLGHDGLIHKFIYDMKTKVVYHEAKEEFEVSDFHPGKRTYPERTDFEFAKLVMKRGGSLCFTTYTEGIEDSVFYGSLHDLYTKYSEFGKLISELMFGSAYLNIEVRKAIDFLSKLHDCLTKGMKESTDQSHLFNGETKSAAIHLMMLKNEISEIELNEKSLLKKDLLFRTIDIAIGYLSKDR